MTWFSFLKGQDGRNTSKRNQFLVLDLGGGYLKGGVLNVKKENGRYVGEMIACRKERREIFSEHETIAVSYEELKGNTLRLSSALRTALRGEAPRNVIFCMDQHFVLVEAMLLKEYREKPRERIDIAEIKNVFQHVHADILDAAEQNHAFGPMKVIDAKIQEMLIDGYKIGNPIGFTGKELAFDVRFSSIPHAHLQIIDALCDDLDLENVYLYSDILSAVSARLGAEGESGNFLALDIGEFMTQVALVKKGKFVKANYFDIGFHAFIKKIGVELAVSISEAEEILAAYFHGELSAHARETIGVLLQAELRLWRNGITIAFEEMGEVGSFPARVVVLGGVSRSPLVGALFDDKMISEYFEGNSAPELLPPDETVAFVQNAAAKVAMQDYFNVFACASNFMSSFYENVLDHNFRRAMRLMRGE